LLLEEHLYEVGRPIRRPAGLLVDVGNGHDAAGTVLPAESTMAPSMSASGRGTRARTGDGDLCRPEQA
jgi:hypothetical protein